MNRRSADSLITSSSHPRAAIEKDIGGEIKDKAYTYGVCGNRHDICMCRVSIRTLRCVWACPVGMLEGCSGVMCAYACLSIACVPLRMRTLAEGDSK